MSASTRHEPVGGSYWTPLTRVLAVLAGIGLATIAVRYALGLRAVSNLSDGYPWGLWISLDVVVGTALGCGGYAVALLVYILNRGQYHPLVRPAVLTSLLGYGLAMFAVVVDLGRPWELWKVPIYFWRWTGSPQLEVALCVMAYAAVLAVELSPAFFERFRTSTKTRLANFSAAGLRLIDRLLPFLLALGMVLPSMHQSTLGTMMLLPGPRLHPLWFTPWLPFLFLVSCLVMGFGIVVVESTLSTRAFGRQPETAMLARLAKVAAGVALFWAVFRVAEVAWSRELPLAFSGRGLAFAAEVLVHLAAVVVLASAARRARPLWQLRAGMLMVLGGALYRVNTYLVAFRPGENWNYFPTIPEFAITIGMFSLEIALYIWVVRRFPILAGGLATSGRSRGARSARVASSNRLTLAPEGPKE
jgi:Ni/Fe-hydrogenase subunit HybB-like protein